jgi:hypothetical protein
LLVEESLKQLDLNPWDELPTSPPYIAPVDRLILDATYQARYQLRCDVLPQAWIGDPRAARVLVLQLNPGFSADDPDEERSIQGYPEAVRHSLSLREPTSFWALDPKLAATGAGRWWRRRLAPLIKGLGSEGEDLVRQRLAVAEFFPYHSVSYRRSPPLPSQEFTFGLVRRAVENGTIILVMRQWKSWSATVPELITSAGQRVFENPNPRQAAISRRNLGDATFDAVLEAVGS